MIGLIIILVFPFIFFYTQMNNFNEKTGNIRKAIEEGKETYYDTTDGFLHWTANGDRVIHCTWWYDEGNGTIKGDKVLMGAKSHHIYKNYTQEKFTSHVQSQINHNCCWCYERHAYNEEFRNDITLRYHMKDKYFYYLIKEEHRSANYDDNRLYLYCERNTGEKRKITFEEYIQLGGSELTEIEYKKKNGYTVTTLRSKINDNQNNSTFNYNDKYLNGGK